MEWKFQACCCSEGDSCPTCPTSAVHQVIKTSWSSLSLGISAAPPAPPPPGTPPLRCSCRLRPALPTRALISQCFLQRHAVNSTQVHAKGNNTVEPLGLVDPCRTLKSRPSWGPEGCVSPSSASDFTLKPPGKQGRQRQRDVRGASFKKFIPFCSLRVGWSEVKKMKTNTSPPLYRLCVSAPQVDGQTRALIASGVWNRFWLYFFFFQSGSRPRCNTFRNNKHPAADWLLV